MKRRLLSLLAALLLLLAPARAAGTDNGAAAEAPASAEEESKLIYMGVEDEFHRYEFADGLGFYSTVQNGESEALLAAFAFDEGVSRVITYEGEVYPYEDGDVIEAEGLYRVVVLDRETMETALFTFSVSAIAGGADAARIDFDALLQELIHTQISLDVALGCSYDPARETYRFAFPDGAGFEANAPNGAIADRVRLSFEADLTAECWHGGEVFDYASGTVLEEEGAYHFRLFRSVTGADGEKTVYTAAYHLLLLHGPVNDMGTLNAPQGFTITSLSRDGQALAPDSPQAARLAGDGHYEARFTSTFQPVAVYTVSFTLDTEAPVLYFSENALSGFADFPVAYAAAEEDSAVQIRLYRDAYPATGLLADNGVYQITVADAAGNVRHYDIRVETPFRLGFPKEVWILIGAAVAALGIWMLWVRRKSRTI